MRKVFHSASQERFITVETVEVSAGKFQVKFDVCKIEAEWFGKPFKWVRSTLGGVSLEEAEASLIKFVEANSSGLSFNKAVKV